MIIKTYFPKFIPLKKIDKKILSFIRSKSFKMGDTDSFMNIIRLFDLFIISFLLIILIPLFVLVSLLSLFTHGKPIIYLSARVGLKGKIFQFI